MCVWVHMLSCICRCYSILSFLRWGIMNSVLGFVYVWNTHRYVYMDLYDFHDIHVLHTHMCEQAYKHTTKTNKTKIWRRTNLSGNISKRWCDIFFTKLKLNSTHTAFQETAYMLTWSVAIALCYSLHTIPNIVPSFVVHKHVDVLQCTRIQT
jgi:hypothetical protein